ncbi:hypothetical protein SAMN02910447_03056 [Ruminococcus sp. YE71]|uniref:hypothetical protein n=1 Tax=unclassified Ruminococcus TaxID=2608920 RepID=UPI00088CAFE8|nr:MULTISPECIES: hypothetical protein [unclassified Ruminococcus]SDA29477.1 hypothetical protein SAMN02910446_03128 [Ruminococcus sp. YE78]SFW48339.1 hypothetical protein SAMN02910447_03056 [Ruminococcus sp. YE71]
MKANTKKNSTTKKLVPAAGSLLISAAMLGTSTYAWFTMSREVELKNIQMTATVPEDIQISIGKIGKTADSTVVSEAQGDGAVGNNTGYVMRSSEGAAVEPRTSGQYQSLDWSNSIDISHYYTFGKLIPASSDTGVNIFFTPDANGIGQTVKTDAKYYQAANGLSPIAESTAYSSGAGSAKLNATAHLKTGDSDAWTGSGATDFNCTYDDGYYVDIPVWLRTSSSEGADLSVKAYVIDKNEITGYGTNTSGTSDGKELYRAVRVAILTSSGSAAAASGTGNLIPVKDGGQTGETGYNGTSILDWYTASSGAEPHPFKVGGGAVSAITDQNSTSVTYTPIATLQSTTNAKGTYNGTSSVVHLANGSGTAYGAMTQVIVRVWLEGEDPDCFNETAGQDWSINLKFEKI